MEKGFQGGATLRVVDDLCATIKPLRKGRSPPGLLRDGRISDEADDDSFLLSLTDSQAQ